MKIIFFGSDEFGIPSLNKLKEKYILTGVVTAPDRPKGRGLKLLPTVIKKWAEENNIPVYTPENLDDEFISLIKSLKPDLIVLISYGKKLPPEILKVPKLCAINLHPSLLPKYRGAAPVEWALINGEKETGITTITMEKKIDSGEIILQKKFPVLPDDNAITLKKRLSLASPDILIESIEKIKKGEKTEKQKGKPSYARKLKKEDGKIDWRKKAVEIHNLIRGVVEWPTAFTFIETEKGRKMIKIFKSEPGKENGKWGKEGEIIETGDDFIEVACGEGTLKIKVLQIEGKKKMGTDEFLRGYKLRPKTFFLNDG